MNVKKILLFILSLIMIFPMIWMITLSFKSTSVFDSMYNLFFSSYTINNYSEIFLSDSFILYIFNSFLVATFVTLLNVIFCLLVAYSLARYNNIFNQIIFISTLSILIIPPHVIMIPLYRLMVNFNWIDTYFALILPWAITPFGIFLLKQFIEKIPLELEDSARIDGASELQIITKIIFPVSKPVIMVLVVYTFLANWNSFLFPFLFTNSESMRTLPVGLTFFLGKQSIDWGQLMAGASIAAFPMIILFLLFKKQILNAMLFGGLKE